MFFTLNKVAGDIDFYESIDNETVFRLLRATELKDPLWNMDESVTQ